MMIIFSCVSCCVCILTLGALLDGSLTLSLAHVITFTYNTTNITVSQMNWVSPERLFISLPHTYFSVSRSISFQPATYSSSLTVYTFSLSIRTTQNVHDYIYLSGIVTFMVHFCVIYQYISLYTHNHCIIYSCLQCLYISLLSLSSHKCTANLCHRHQWNL